MANDPEASVSPGQTLALRKQQHHIEKVHQASHPEYIRLAPRPHKSGEPWHTN